MLEYKLLRLNWMNHIEQDVMLALPVCLIYNYDFSSLIYYIMLNLNSCFFPLWFHVDTTQHYSLLLG